jgi:excisionase family DNA binding protein
MSSTHGHESTNNDCLPLLLTIKQVMELTGISRSKIYDFLTTGQLASVYVGSSRRIKREDLFKFLGALDDQVRQ